MIQPQDMDNLSATCNLAVYEKFGRAATFLMATYLISIMGRMGGRMGSMHVKDDSQTKDIKHFFTSSPALGSFPQTKHFLHGAEETLDAPIQLQRPHQLKPDTCKMPLAIAAVCCS